MPKQGFGGDDDIEEVPEEPKPPSLDKFGLSPDANIRDLFWKIMGSYAATKSPGVDISTLEEDRFALMRVAVSILSQEHSNQYGLSPKFITLYTIQMLIDGGWEDALADFLMLALEKKHRIKDIVIQSLRKIQEKEKIVHCMSSMLRSSNDASVALEYIANLDDAELSMQLKKELVIFARGDIGENQKNAIKAISSIGDQDEVKKTFIILLSHWDEEARLAAARALKSINDDEVKGEAAKRLETENNDEIRRILKEILK
ncbi:hypothetical protein JXA56_01255 [Candidatus Micrarchaeota archaeon]|nr:hypothetical protein [Candidatus Micrarchaeota archaeon]